jgi:hypothetical protein
MPGDHVDADPASRESTAHAAGGNERVPPAERVEEELAAREAAAIGGVPAERPGDEARVPVEEAGGGEAEGFEQAEAQLIENASHGDELPAHAVTHDRGSEEEPSSREDGEADHEYSSETGGDGRA